MISRTAQRLSLPKTDKSPTSDVRATRGYGPLVCLPSEPRRGSKPEGRARLAEPETENSRGSFVPPARCVSSAIDSKQTRRRDEFALPFSLLHYRSEGYRANTASQTLSGCYNIAPQSNG
jgi:hypothetical protein